MAPPSRLGPESWDDLFNFLDPDRRSAAGADRDRRAEVRCEEVLRKLVVFFASRRSLNAEDLAMETVLRVAAKCRSVDVDGYNDRVGYFYGVARNVLHESHRSALRESSALESLKRELIRHPVPDEAAWQQTEAVHRCLERCMARLPERARKLIVGYHGGEKDRQAAAHRTLADEFGKSVNALRIEVYRVRRALLHCVSECLGGPASHRDVASGLSP
jgi:RNA polymerase sigma factor (sigma-70 family)